MKIIFLTFLFIFGSQVLSSISEGSDGVVILDEDNYKEYLRHHDLAIIQYYHVSQDIGIHRRIEGRLSQLSIIMGRNKHLYPFAKVSVGHNGDKITEDLPNIVIFQRNKAKFQYHGEDSLTQIYGWLKDSLTDLGYPVPDEIEKEVYAIIQIEKEKDEQNEQIDL